MHARPRTRGPKPHPIGRLTPELFRGIRTSGPSLTSLATASGFPSLPHLSKLLYADRVPMTPLVIERLKKLAEIIQFKGDLFEASR